MVNFLTNEVETHSAVKCAKKISTHDPSSYLGGIKGSALQLIMQLGLANRF